MKALIVLLGLFLCAYLFFAFYQQEQTAETSSPARVMNDSIYTGDSLKIEELYIRGWEYVNTQNYGKLISVTDSITQLGKNLLGYRQDSIILDRYLSGLFGHAQSRALMGRHEEGLQEMLAVIDTMIHYFGVYYPRLSENYVGVTILYSFIDDQENALKYLEKSFDVIQKAYPKEHPYRFNSYNNLVAFHIRTEKYHQAIIYLKLSIEARKSADKLRVPTLKATIANVLLSMNKYEESRRMWAEVLADINDEVYQTYLDGNYYKYILSRYYFGMGRFYKETGKKEKAKEYFLKCIEICPTYDYVNSSVVVSNDAYRQLAEIFKEEGNYQRFKELSEQALIAYKEVYDENNLDVTTLYNQLAVAYAALNNIDSALYYHQQSMRLLIPNFEKNEICNLPNIDDIIISTYILNALSTKVEIQNWYYKHSHDENITVCMAESYKLIAQVVDEMFLHYKSDLSKELIFSQVSQIYKNATELFIQQFQRSPNPDFLEKAFYYTEKGKSFVLLTSLRNSHAKEFAGVAKESIASEQDIKIKVAFYEKLVKEEEGKLQNQDKEKLQYWREKVLYYKHANDSLMTVIEKRYPAYYKLKFDFSLATIADVQANLDKQTALLKYFLGDSTLYLFTITKESVLPLQIPIDDAFFQNLQQMDKLLRQPKTGKAAFTQFVTTARDLYKILLEPAEKQLNDIKNLVIIPDGTLGYLPFQVLLTEEPKYGADYKSLPYLLKKYNVQYEYSATLLIENQKQKHQHKLYAGFAPTYQGGELMANRGEDSSLVAQLYPTVARDGLSPLEYNQPEVEEVARRFRGVKYLGADATEHQFKNMTNRAGILHLAMHALINDSEPLYSQLVFTSGGDSTEDGHLNAYEIYNTRLNAQLAVLSACNTGAGKLQRGEGIMSLSRAFKYAGCPNIVMSHWLADDASTKELITGFFTELKQGKGKSEALRLAQQTYLENADAAKTHPYFWANFVLIGDNEPVRIGMPVWLWGIGGIILAVVLYLWRKRRIFTQAA